LYKDSMMQTPTSWNALLVGPAAAPQPPLATIAEQALRSHPHRGAFKQVRCLCRAGVLMLRGRVSSYFLKQVAQSAVSQIDGVKRVINRIEVVA